jgi:hypothetical protein
VVAVVVMMLKTLAVLAGVEVTAELFFPAYPVM